MRVKLYVEIVVDELPEDINLEVLEFMFRDRVLRATDSFAVQERTVTPTGYHIRPMLSGVIVDFHTEDVREL